MNRRKAEKVMAWMFVAFAALVIAVFVSCVSRAHGAECTVVRPTLTAQDNYLAKAQMKIMNDGLAENGSIIDVMVGYDHDDVVSAGSEAAMQSRIGSAVDHANQARINSGIASRLRLVWCGLWIYTETHNSSTDLYNLQGGRVAGVMALRDQVGADLVCFVLHDIGGPCGTGYLLDNDLSSRSYGFCVVQLSCLAAPQNSLAHEFGHNEGAQHDPANAFGPGAFAYSYGARSAGGNYGDTMAYGTGRQELFSGPNSLAVGKYPLGDAAHDNTRTLNETALIDSNFEPHKIPDGATPTPTPSPTAAPPATPQPGADYVTFPATVTRGMSYNITFQITGPKQVQGFIQNAAGTKYQITPGSYVANTGTFLWTVTQPVGTYTLEFIKGYDKTARVESAQKIQITP